MHVRQADLEQNINDERENSREITLGNIESVSEPFSESSKPVDVSSRVWKLFLDSKCSSAIVFFRLHVSARTYFRSPTPWNPGAVTILSRKVSQLLDSFRPGSSSYSPFHKKADENNNASNQNNEVIVDENNNGGFQFLRPSAIRVNEGTNQDTRTKITGEIHEKEDKNLSSDQLGPGNGQSAILSPEDENRRRLYLNLGRPRPFYRLPSRNDENEQEAASPIKPIKRRRLLTLKECSRNQIVSTYGLKNLRKVLGETKCSARLPEAIRNFLFTFSCQDFEEDGFDRPLKSASYNVWNHLDGNKYTAVFATSDADKAASNIWKEETDWLNMDDPGVTKILAIAVDPLTENIFYIIPEQGSALINVINCSGDLIDMGNGTCKTREEVAELARTQLKSTLERLQRGGKPYPSLKEEHIVIYEGQVLLENKLLVKLVRKTFNLEKLKEHEQNLHKLDCILDNLLQ